MAKQTGLGDNFYIAGFDLSGDVGAADSITVAQATLPSTGINKSGNERLAGLKDGAVSFTSYFNDAAGAAHPALKTVPAADRIVSYYRGTTLGNSAASMVAKQVDYAGNRNDDGSLTFKVNAQANGFGLEWGNMLTAGKRTDGSATNGSPFDFGADQTGFFDAQAYLQVFSFTGTDVTVKIQTSQDNAVDPYNDRITFTQITGGAPLAERKTMTTPGSQVMERFVRAVTVTTGGFSSLVFAVMVVINPQAVGF